MKSHRREAENLEEQLLIKATRIHVLVDLERAKALRGAPTRKEGVWVKPCVAIANNGRIRLCRVAAFLPLASWRVSNGGFT